MADQRIDPRKTFTPQILPWIIAAVALAIYVLTLNHWVSLFNLTAAARICGWVWVPQVLSPLTFLLTLPFRALPAAIVPVSLNLFSAVCAALTLALLARSVALLPHDRTAAQRKREKSDFSFLTIPFAWLPPVFAAVICGLQITFWEHATNFTGEQFDLLLFAFVIWSLLEYRLDEREGRLVLAAFVYGAAMAENWAMVGFFPLFFVAVIWIRGTAFFEPRFLGRFALCGVLGLLFYLLLPLVAVSGQTPLTFWEALKFNLAYDRSILKTLGLCFLHPGNFVGVLPLALAYLISLLLPAIRWPASFGDSSRRGTAVASFVFHIAHGFFLGLFIWMAFDPPFSPRNLSNFPFLPFYYLGALAIGYYAGYFLLIFGRPEMMPAGLKPRPQPFQFLNKPLVICIWLAAILSTVGLMSRNVAQICITNGDALHRYAKLAAEKLPRTGGYLLSDDINRLMLVRSALAQDGRDREFVPLETGSLQVPAYQKFLHYKYPQKWPAISVAETNLISPFALVQTLVALSQTNSLFYLEPSFGYFFERFYSEPHGLIYQLKPLPPETLLPPPPDNNLIADNENFWRQEAAPALAKISTALIPPDPNAPKRLQQKILEGLRLPDQPEHRLAAISGVYYSRALDFWGEQLQHAGKLDLAATNFQSALQVNADNAAAQINLAFNQKLRAGQPATVDLSQATLDHLGNFRDWNGVFNVDGPLDEPSFCFTNGAILFRDAYFRQAAAQFDRVSRLVPNFLPARLMLAQSFLFNHLPEPALLTLREPLDNPEKFAMDETNKIAVVTLAAVAYFLQTNNTHAIQLLDSEMARHPDDENWMAASAQIFIARGLFTNALALIDRRLKADPDATPWLYSKGYVSIQLKKYPEAISAFNRVLEIQTNNYDALFNRAIANLDSEQFDSARADYLRLQQTFTNAPPVAYGLGEIAWHNHDTNEAIRNYQIYLANARTDTAEAKNVAARLRELKK